jgi:hypothetical protein
MYEWMDVSFKPFPFPTTKQSDPQHVQLHSRSSNEVAYDERKVADLFQPLR